jgi:hypothetical protein
MNDFAPVLVCTLNRHVHFKRCIESLAACTNADKTDLFIGFDYPLKDCHWEGYEIIKAYLLTIKGFKTVNIVAREKNFSILANWTGMIEYVFDRYDRIIISEDDNVFATSFLSYINGGLSYFEKDPLVQVICGYKFPFDVPESYPYNYFYSKGFSGWGFGIWKNKYQTQWNDNSIKEINKYLRKPWKALRLNSYQYGLYDGLMHIVNTGKFTGDRMYCFSNLVNGTYSVFPTVSKVRNTGHDGSGANSTKMEGSKNIFVNQLIDTETKFNYLIHHEYENKIVRTAFKKHILNYNYLRLHHKIIQILNYSIFLVKH